MTQFSIQTKEGAYQTRTLVLGGDQLLDFHNAIFGRGNFEVHSLAEFEELEKKKVRAFLLKKLAKRNYCSSELIQLLKKYLVKEDLIQSIIQEFLNSGYINDQDYIESIIRLGQGKKCGADWILQKLKSKGIKEGVAREAIRLNDTPKERVLRIKKLIETKYKRRNLTDFKERNKIIASLLRKGFSFEEIKDSFNTTEED